MNIFEGIFLGIVQGITEFLPISSTGHLELGRILLNVQIQDNLSFIIIVHLATLLSIVVVFRKRIWELIVGLVKRDAEITKYVLLLILSSLPVLFFKILLDRHLDTIFSDNLIYMGLCFIINGLLMFAIIRIPTNAKFKNHITPKISLWMGLGQALAVLPAISRSGSTIFAGLIHRVNKEEVAEFAFLMSIIPIAGASLLQIKDLLDDPTNHAADTGLLLVSFVTAFIVGILACKLMIELVKKLKLKFFAIYCVLLGLFTILLYFIQNN